MKAAGHKLLSMWQDTDSLGITAKCEYDDLTGTYVVTVSKGDVQESEQFSQTFTPYFGIDVADVAMSQQLAEKLALTVEKRLGLK